MARPLRSLVTVAQASIAGPSSLRPLAVPALRSSPVHQTQVRNAFSLSGWDKYLPSFRRGGSDEPIAAAEKGKKDEQIIDLPATTGEKDGGEEVASTGGLFDDLAKESGEEKIGKRRRRRGTDTWTEHSYSSARHKISHRKLNDLSRQIAGLPVDEAIVQMQFSEKRASSWVKSTLAIARDHAMDKNLKRDKLVVAETWVSKGPKIQRLDIKGRGKYGIKHHPSAKIHVVLREGKTHEEKMAERFEKDLRRVRSAGVVREDGVIRRKVVSGWTW
ncbi:50S small subunit ribosomal protein L22 [Kwoniella heveanensis CBS 569]|nr:50S small subunit ribosomal protein L22 [Kwoniella heveanensis CBS 569]